MPKGASSSINGWEIYAHPVFTEQFRELVEKVRIEAERNPGSYQKKSVTKLLAAVLRVIEEVIPHDPGSSVFRQGGTLGEENKHWRRANFLQQYRIFFRYEEKSKIIVLSWMNDEDTKRARESRTDAYRVFRKMLESGRPPSNWEALLKEAADPAAVAALDEALAATSTD